ncbi:MAG: lysylphosphatidylglycerol synthase transmembrane domain-containing protein [Candidatus Omnitrophota bacterium]
MKKQTIAQFTILIGVLLFSYIVYRIGPIHILANIKKLTFGNFFILMGLRLLYWSLRTVNWKVILDHYDKNTSLWELFVARMYSQSVNELFPAGQVGGEAARIYMVHTIEKRISVASVIVDKTVEFLSVLILTVLAVGYILFRLAISPAFKMLLIAVEFGFATFMFFIILKQRHGLLTWFVTCLSRLKIHPKFVERNKDKIRETDHYIADFYRRHPLGFVKVLMLYFLLVMLWVTEIYLTIRYIGAKDITFGDSFLITILGNLMFLFPFVPGMLGAYEATYIGIFALLKKRLGVAFTLVLIRRIISLLLACLGLLVMIRPLFRRRIKA